jgi:hypothetical protein
LEITVSLDDKRYFGDRGKQVYDEMGEVYEGNMLGYRLMGWTYAACIRIPYA